MTIVQIRVVWKFLLLTTPLPCRTIHVRIPRSQNCVKDMDGSGCMFHHQVLSNLPNVPRIVRSCTKIVHPIVVLWTIIGVDLDGSVATNWAMYRPT